MHKLEFNVGTGSIHQLPQTTGDGIQSSAGSHVGRWWHLSETGPPIVPICEILPCTPPP